MSTPNNVWSNFTRTGKFMAKCKICGTEIQRPNYGTTEMIRHLKVHNINVSTNSDNDPSTSSQNPGNSTKIENFLLKESLDEILAKCSAKDGFSFRAITKSEAIGGYVRSRGYKMPKTQSEVTKKVMQFFEEKKEETKNILKSLQKKGQRFSITCDEWSDINIRRFLNVTIHTQNFPPISLGLTLIRGSCDSVAIEKMVREKLDEFGLNLDKDLVASTHDGASVMERYGKDILAVSQLCYNHALHLAVTDVLYKKKDKRQKDKNPIDIDALNDSTDELENFDGELLDGNINFVNDEDSDDLEMRGDFKKILNETRKTILFFKKSAVKNQTLQGHVLEQEGKELKLLLDSKTRWNSILPMVTRFLKLKDCINQSLEEFDQPAIPDKNIKYLEELEKALMPFDLAVKELSKDDSDIIKAEGTSIFLLNQLEQQNSKLSEELFETAKARIIYRRNRDLISLLLFLHNGEYPKENNYFPYSSEHRIKSFANELFNRLFNEETQMTSSTPVSEIDSTCSSISDELQKTISSLFAPTVSQSVSVFDKELKYVENNSGKRGELTNKLFAALKTIQPTSTASERAFSLSSQFVTKIRNRLSAYNLNGLVFLKYYFLKKN